MGFGETQLKRWGYGMASSLIVVGILLLVMSSMSISYASGKVLKSDLQGVAGFFIVVSIGALAVGGYAIYKIYKLHQLYLNVSSETGLGKLKLKQPPPQHYVHAASAVQPTTGQQTVQTAVQQQQQQQPPVPSNQTGIGDYDFI